MDRLFILKNHRNNYFVGHALIRVWALLFCSSLGALPQNTAPPVSASAPFSIQATHLLGLENTKSNCNGTLSIQGDALQFQQGGKPGSEVKITSIQAVSLGGESKQVGGVPMKLGKAAAPFGSGSLAQLHRHSTDLLALPTQKNSMDRSDFYLCAGLPALLKLQRIALNGQSSVAVALCVFQTQKMSGRNAEWCARVYWGSGALGQCA